MKQIVALFSGIILVLSVLFCTTGCTSNLFEDNNAIADATFREVLTAIRDGSEEKLKALFSPSVQNGERAFDDSVAALSEFIQGDIVSYSDARERGVSATHTKTNGKANKEIESSFLLQTTVSTYHIAIVECTIDENDSERVGILKLCIIRSDDWDHDYAYRGNSDVASGIVIEKGSQSE